MKALALLSGGLDSTLAAKLVLEQGLDVEAVNFVTPFCQCRKGGCGASEAAEALKIPLKVFTVGEEYLDVVKKPKYGYGKNMNPCIDCRIFMLKKAKQYAKAIGAVFIFTGEVLGQRPMSQHKRAFAIIEAEAGLRGKIVRPLSAKLLPKTNAEEEGLIVQNGLLDVQGRSRKKQIQFMKRFNELKYPCPSGGCLLTDRAFANKLRDLLAHKKRVTLREVNLLKVGRHFRFGKNKIIVGRNNAENHLLTKTRLASDYLFEVPNCGSPTSILQGPKTNAAIHEAARLTAFHSDKEASEVVVNFGKTAPDREITVLMPSSTEVEELRIPETRNTRSNPKKLGGKQASA